MALPTRPSALRVKFLSEDVRQFFVLGIKHFLCYKIFRRITLKHTINLILRISTHLSVTVYLALALALALPIAGSVEEIELHKTLGISTLLLSSPSSPQPSNIHPSLYHTIKPY